MKHLPEAFAAWAQYPQFILYKLSDNPKTGKKDKTPVAPFDRQHDTTGINAQRSGWWVDFNTAVACAEALGPDYGVAFVLTANDPFFLLDLDGCLTPSGWSDVALSFLNRLAGAGVEVSQSGNGLHILGSCSVFDHGCKNKAINSELYTSGRFVALTGNSTGGDVRFNCDGPLQQIAAEYFPVGTALDDADWTTEPREDWNGYTCDDALIARAKASASVSGAFGGRATFAQLFDADQEALGRCYPDSGRPFDESSADAALAQHLAFWTGCDCERIERIMRMSALVREKWDNHSSYMHRTITYAVGQQKDVHKLKNPAPIEYEPVAPSATFSASEPELVSGFQYLAIDQQLDHFKGCVYVQQNHSILTPDGELLKPDQFKATYGGYLFALDSTNSKQTKNAWEAFAESQAIRHVKVHRTWFKPEQPFGTVTDCDGFKYVNTYKPIEVPSAPGDVGPFLKHLQLCLPNENDQQILLAYMAAVVQFKGCKFQWAPLIQGAEGNGKTLFSRCVAQAVGKRYSHFPRADEIGEKYNEWLFDKVFIGVEDIYVPEQKRELMEVLKPMITAEDLEERAMQKAKVMKPLCSNFIFNSNYQDAVKKGANDRRFAPFFCAQQSEEDVLRDMPPSYFSNLYTWLKQRNGFAAVTHYLQTYAIPAELNPALDHGGLAERAPKTTSTSEAVRQSLGRLEQEILEAVDEARPGFAGGWISSTALDRLLEQSRAADRMPRNKRKTMIESLGYSYHPSLEYSQGRTSCVTTTDGNKPRLYLKRGHISAQITDPAEVVRAYDKAQSLANQTHDPAVANVFGKK